MASFTEVLQKLTDREKAMFFAEQDAAARVREAESKVTGSTEQLMELKRAQDQELRVMKAQNEKRIRDMSYNCRRKVHQAQKERAELEALADTAEKRQQRAEAHVTNLEQKIADLKAMLQRRTRDAENRIADSERMMAVRLDRVSVQAEGRVRSMAHHTKEVCMAAGWAVETAHDELQDQMSRASVRAEGRTRFKELCDLAKSWDRNDMTKEAYSDVKEDLIALWHSQAQSRPGSAPSAPFDISSRASPNSQLKNAGEEALRSARSALKPDLAVTW